MTPSGHLRLKDDYVRALYSTLANSKRALAMPRDLTLKRTGRILRGNSGGHFELSL